MQITEQWSTRMENVMESHWVVWHFHNSISHLKWFDISSISYKLLTNWLSPNFLNSPWCFPTLVFFENTSFDYSYLSFNLVQKFIFFSLLPFDVQFLYWNDDFFTHYLGLQTTRLPIFGASAILSLSDPLFCFQSGSIIADKVRVLY